MNRYILLLMLAAVCFAGSAQSRNGSAQSELDKEIEKVSRDLEKQVIPKLEEERDSLTIKIDRVDELISRLRDRLPSADPSENADDLESYLLYYSSLKDMLGDNKKNNNSVYNRIHKDKNAKNSKLRAAYLFIFDMIRGLENPYGKTSNENCVDKISGHRRSILKKHLDEFDEYAALVKDYEYYMYELARLFVAAKEDNFTKNAKDLAEYEGAADLLKIPYTKSMLEKFIKDKGMLIETDKEKLRNSCPEAFPDL